MQKMQNKLPNLFQKNNQHQKNQGKRNPFQNNKFQLRKKKKKSGKPRPSLEFQSTFLPQAML